MTHILIIEDQPVMRKNLSIILEMEGYELSPPATEAKALPPP